LFGTAGGAALRFHEGAGEMGRERHDAVDRKRKVKIFEPVRAFDTSLIMSLMNPWFL
jgi:hypothetical protein